MRYEITAYKDYKRVSPKTRLSLYNQIVWTSLKEAREVAKRLSEQNLGYHFAVINGNTGFIHNKYESGIDTWAGRETRRS